jgi:hypothetical protein
MCLLRISEQTTFVFYKLTDWFFIAEAESACSAVGNESLYKRHVLSLKGYYLLTCQVQLSLACVNVSLVPTYCIRLSSVISLLPLHRPYSKTNVEMSADIGKREEQWQY